MENNDLIISRNALTSLEAARSYLQHSELATEDFAIIDAINEATGIMELRTGRALHERIFENVQTLSLTTVADNYTATGTGLGVLRAGSDAVGVNLRPEARIASIAANGLSLILTQPPALGGAANITFGSEPLVQRWPGGSAATLDQFPVEAVYSLKVIGSDGTKTAIDITGYWLEKAAGILHLAGERPAKGETIELEYKAGYRPTTATDRGHGEEWRSLRRICHRITQLLYQDYRHQLGRSLEVQIRDQIVRFSDLSLPKDVEQALDDFKRMDV